ncbi:aldehyde dehydrogenase family protein [Cognatishimia maritima]|uniref:Aldehyde dehydrogenase (NAD+) n=1 Tax=Cognatishimia maritima TaxID=870908 RepID=A0A1M5QBS5_9RHOB|nr:aldehyde dehydrogenase family protein [Cognatishimia maritima]SHH10963.1 aldehyde dehydrogenase (NAD+) [Cognatishimia maritima]
MNMMEKVTSEVRGFLASPLKLAIGGKQVDAKSSGTFRTFDPGTGEPIATLADGGAEDIDIAVKAAREAFNKSGWATMPSKDRAKIINKLADLIERDTAILGELESKDVGKPREQALAFDIPHTVGTFRYYADLSAEIEPRVPFNVEGSDAWSVRLPYGVCGFIFPWNFPFLLLGWGVAPALAAGNTVVIKPAEETPLTALYFAKLAAEAGVPDGVVNVVTGGGATAGAALAKHPDINRMSFTGSPEVGKMVAEACASNLTPAKLELGGKGAAVVFDDVDVDQAAKGLVGAITLNAGQVCCTASRWLVHENIAEEFINKAVAEMKGMKIGYGGEEASQIGPVVSEKQRSRVLGYLERAAKEGAEIYLAGGEEKVPGHDGFYIKPALLGGSPENIAAREEIFGPVAYIMTFKDEDEAIELVNSSPYGLANSVWTTDLDRAKRVSEKLVAGNSWINGHNLFNHGVSYGGCNLSGCGGGVLGADTLEDYYRRQSVVRPL